MAANEDKLGSLHTQVAEVLSEALEGTVLPEERDEDGNVLFAERRIPPSAAILQVAAKFLKDNNITCTPSQDNALGELEEKMRRRQERRGHIKPTAADFKDAEDGMNFLKGLPN